MPTYEYACGACGHQWEEVQRISAAPTEVCPKCAQSAAHRLISGGTNFILKGGGWYSDLYSSSKSSSKASEASSSGSSASSSDSGTSKTESKTPSAAPAAPTPSSTPSSSSSS